MRRHAILALLALLSMLPGGAAVAETCNEIAPGSYFWTAISNNLWTDGDCAESADDTFVIPSGVHITVGGNVTLSTGTIQIQTGGTLYQMGGTTISWTGATAGGLEVLGGTYTGQGVARWRGRIGSAITYATGPKRASFTLPIADVSTIASTSDYVQILDDDPASDTAEILQPIQSASGPPIPGYYRASLRKWAFHKIQATPASSTLTIHTDEFTDVESLAPANTPYEGTRGPARPTDTAITGTPTRALYSNGTRGRIVYGDIVSVDGDLGGQYVEFTSGACSNVDGKGLGRNKRFKIDWVDNEGGGAGVDWVYVVGDPSGCGTDVNTRIHYGLAEGDPIRIVRPAVLAGTAGQTGPNIFVTDGGTFQLDLGRIVHLDDADLYSTADWSARCNICFFYLNSAPNLADSYITNTEVGYPQPGSADTYVIGFMNLNQLATGTLVPSNQPLDLTGMVLGRIYVHDQAYDDSGSTAGSHGFGVSSTTGLDLARLRVERTADDGFVGFDNGFSVGTPTLAKVRHVVVSEIFESSGSSNSAQCVDIVAGNTSSATDIFDHAWRISDVFASGCADGALSLAALNGSIERLVTLGGQSAGVGFRVTPGSTFPSIPVGSVSSSPNLVRNVFASLAGTVTSSFVAEPGGRLFDAVIVGNLATASNRGIHTATETSGVFANFGAESGAPISRGTSDTDPGGRITSTELTDTTLLNSGVGAHQLCSNYFNNDSVTSTLAAARLFVGFERVAGLLTTCLQGTDETQPFIGDGITLSVITQNNWGIGRGTDDQGTDEGRNITNACIEAGTTNARNSIFSFGAGVTDSSIHIGDGLPDADDDVGIGAFVQQPNDDSLCNLARPRRLGLSQVGASHALLGDGFVDGIENFTTDRALIRQISGRFSSPIFPSSVTPDPE